MLFVVVGATDTNVRRSTGVTTANSTNIRNTVELGDQLFGHVHTAKCTVCVPYKVYSVCGDPAGRGESVQSVEAF